MLLLLVAAAVDFIIIFVIDFPWLFSATYDALVVKASGLAAGKGVIVANSREEACAAVDEILGDLKYGSAGSKIVVEEKLSGEEVSVSLLVCCCLSSSGLSAGIDFCC